MKHEDILLPLATRNFQKKLYLDKRQVDWSRNTKFFVFKSIWLCFIPYNDDKPGLFSALFPIFATPNSFK